MRRFVAALCLFLIVPASARAQVVGNFSRIYVNSAQVRAGNGSPEGVVTGNIGDVWYRRDAPGGIYIKLSGTGNTGWALASGSGGAGGVTSVGLTAPATLFAVSGSPITSSGSLGITLANQAQNTIFAGPASGGAGSPVWRQIVFSDIASNGCTTGQIPKYNGTIWTCSDDAGAASGAPTGATYVTVATDATLTNERVLTEGTNIDIVDGGAGGAITISTTIPATGLSQTTYLISGGQIAWQSAYLFNVSAARYAIDGVEYASTQQIATLAAAHATLDRIDVIAVDDTGTVVVVQGTASATPSEPETDPSTQLKLGIVFVGASTTQPAGLTNTILYTENGGGGGGEWNWTTSGSGFAVNSTASPRTGTTSIEGTTVAAAAYAQGQMPSGTIDPSTYTNLVFHILSKATWANKRTLKVQFASSGILKGQAITIQTGTFGFNSSNTATYQQIAIPIVQFAVPAGTTVNEVRITDAGGAIGFYIDDVVLQGGGSSGQTGTGISIEQADARYAPIGAAYVTTTTNATLTAERALSTTPGSLSIAGQYYTPEFNAGNSGTALTLDWDNGNQQRTALTDNVTLTLNNPREGARYMIVFTQDATGGRTVTWPSAVKWTGGTAPVMTTAANAVDLCTLAYSDAGAGNIYLGQCNMDIK